jgi:DNA primase large subunit
LTRQLIEERVQDEQNKKERFLECLSDFVVELDKDKKHLAEDCFTLDEVVQMIIMDGKGKGKNRS